MRKLYRGCMLCCTRARMQLYLLLAQVPLFAACGPQLFPRTEFSMEASQMLKIEAYLFHLFHPAQCSFYFDISFHGEPVAWRCRNNLWSVFVYTSLSQCQWSRVAEKQCAEILRLSHCGVRIANDDFRLSWSLSASCYCHPCCDSCFKWCRC